MSFCPMMSTAETKVECGGVECAQYVQYKDGDGKVTWQACAHYATALYSKWTYDNTAVLRSVDWVTFTDKSGKKWKSLVTFDPNVGQCVDSDAELHVYSRR